ncbi:MAG: GNAT family N-acetyltransferase [Planctomycetaceae bacterium]|nr:GNAT family N-acetyltransferase [Planctomycetaceae bacterium]
MNFQLRTANPDDAPAILSLIQGLADYEHLSHEIVATESLLRATLFGEHSVAECLLAEVSGAAVGFALFFQNYSTFLGRPGIYLEDLFVMPEFRKQGIGKALFQEVARLAVERNCGRMEWSVLDWNQPAIDFYRSMGAQSQEEWTVYRLTGETLQQAART